MVKESRNFQVINKVIAVMGFYGNCIFVIGRSLSSTQSEMRKFQKTRWLKSFKLNLTKLRAFGMYIGLIIVSKRSHFNEKSKRKKLTVLISYLPIFANEQKTIKPRHHDYTP